MSRFRVCVFKPKGRNYYQAQWSDPETGRKKTKSTGQTKKRDAERVAAVIEKELREGSYREQRRVKWADFRERFEIEHVASKREKTQWKIRGTLNLLEELIRPGLLNSLDAAAIGQFAVRLRKSRSEATVRGHLSNVRSMLNWAKRVELIHKVPRIDMPKAARAGGRPVTPEEFERMLGKVPAVMGEQADSWRELLYGLWWSGLRLDEAMQLHWTDDRQLCVDFSGRRPMLRIKPNAHKSGKDCTLPMAPEFAAFLERTPEADRDGFVFNPRPVGKNPRSRDRMRTDTVSKVISRIGRLANVKVAEMMRQGKRRVKYASAHDFRRAFGFRWAMRVMPPTLMLLMRHESIETTMRYYVGRNAEAAADALWDAVAGSKSAAAANTLANTGPNASPADSVATPQAE